MDSSEYASALHMARYDTGGCLSTIGEIADEVVVALGVAEARVAALESDKYEGTRMYDELERQSGLIEYNNGELRRRVEELEGVIRELHDQVDRAMGDTDIDDDPLVEAMGDAWNAISEQTGVGPAPDQGGEAKPC